MSFTEVIASHHNGELVTIGGHVAENFYFGVFTGMLNRMIVSRLQNEGIAGEKVANTIGILLPILELASVVALAFVINPELSVVNAIPLIGFAVGEFTGSEIANELFSPSE